MASVMKRAIHCDQTTAQNTKFTIKNLMDQNENLRQLMGLSHSHSSLQPLQL